MEWMYAALRFIKPKANKESDHNLSVSLLWMLVKGFRHFPNISIAPEKPIAIPTIAPAKRDG